MLKASRWLGVALIAIVVGCGGPLNGPVEIGGTVIDIKTGETVTQYTAKVRTAAGEADADVDAEGRLHFNLPAGADFQITIEKDGYQTFVSTNEFPTIRNEEQDGNRVWEKMKLLVNIPLAPNALKTPEIDATVTVNEIVPGTTTGTTTTRNVPAKEGSFRIVSTGPDATLFGALFRNGSAGPTGPRTGTGPRASTTHGNRWLLPDMPIVAGAIGSNGKFSVAEGTLPIGHAWSITVFNVPGYEAKSEALTFTGRSLRRAIDRADIQFNLNALERTTP